MPTTLRPGTTRGSSKARTASFICCAAIDDTKDQSYFLFTLGQDELARTIFPLGAMTKTEVRARARALGLATADKPESQEICFVPDGDYASFVERLSTPAQLRPGSIVDSDGKRLADHAGVHRFTVGQRRGLGVASGERLYVREIRADSGEVVAGRARRARFIGPDRESSQPGR